ncbi:PilX N-terminal domain-containing pilus assembly protein [Marinobacter sp. HL-58]|uniref:pilus assembly PilX family protein n=1 Tax=Marinobacter sp. HL-58 TaxID=1479237 RepID=UPI00048401EB|nr:PilX N-terminal domain-containing pilus assembly protein [Marinobacter sp. HL-58]KPQ01846.1 MAG: T4SS system assembly protein PilX [Marinobacter sp. HL-58]
MKSTNNLRQRMEAGSALIVSLIMLLLLSLIGLGGMQSTILQERMASNLHDRNIAFQASERALREGEDWLVDSSTNALTNDRLDEPASWDGNDADAVTVETLDDQLFADPAYHVGWVAEYCPSPVAGDPCYDRFAVTSRAQGGTDTSIVILQSMFMPEPD